MSEVITRDQLPSEVQVVTKSQAAAGLYGEMTPDKVAKAEELDKQDVMRRAMQVKAASDAAEQERRMLHKEVHDNANPDPIVVGFCAALVVLAVWILYRMYLKPNASGEWRDSLGEEWQIKHGAFSSDVDVCINGKKAGHMKIIDNYVRYGDLVGVWNYKDTIIFTEGVVLNRVI